MKTSNENRWAFKVLAGNFISEEDLEGLGISADWHLYLSPTEPPSAAECNQLMNSYDLSACPCCGGRATIIGTLKTCEWSAICTMCGLETAHMMQPKDAASAWNMRYAPDEEGAALRAQPAGGGGEGYSLDADPRGIRAATADAITGALAFGAQGNNPPPAGHWLLPFWKAARADASGWLTVLDLLRTDSNGKKWNCIASRAGSWVDVSPYFEPQPISSPDGADAFSYGASALTQPQPVDRSCTCHPDDNPPNPCAKKYALTDCKATPPESGGQGEAVAWLEPHHLGALRKRRQNKEAGYILVEVCDSETEDYCVPLYTHPPAQASGAVTEAMVEAALAAFWNVYNRAGKTGGGRQQGKTYDAIVAALVAAEGVKP